MLRGRSAKDNVLPSGEAPYSSREASCVGMLLDRVILGGAPTGLGTGRRAEGSLQKKSYKQVIYLVILSVCMRIHTYTGLRGAGQGGG